MSQVSSKAEARRALDASGDIRGVYRHYKGGTYIVFAVSLQEDNLDRLIHYYSVEKRIRWTRTWANFRGIAGERDEIRFVFQREATREEMLEAAGLAE